MHCVVARDECPRRVLQDGFVIIPAQTKFHEIVAVVLRSMEADVGKIEHDERIDGKRERESGEKDDWPDGLQARVCVYFSRWNFD